MPTTRYPRFGSMQFWPRKRAKRIYARVRAYPSSKEPKALGFAGYKVGMVHVIAYDTAQNSMTKGAEIMIPATIIECPPIKAASMRFYKKSVIDSRLVSEILADSLDKELGRKIKLPKKARKKVEDIKDFDEIRLNVYTQPKLTCIGKKKPEFFEIVLGGNKDEQLSYAKQVLGKELRVSDIFSEGMLVDVHAITTAMGVQGPVKRFGIGLRRHKSEKTKRGPGSLGAWKAQGHIMYRVSHAGQTGFHQRMEHNKMILKISDDVKKINSKGGFIRYGVVRNPYILLKGSVPGPSKRLIRFNPGLRAFKSELPQISYISVK